ncbi:MAG TPA: hypothetical protein VMF07_04525, partial [Solirubrobacteraceae bacterium]|nr:hypothetical protein [Solirubrobacteraceae bacterium]
HLVVDEGEPRALLLQSASIITTTAEDLQVGETDVAAWARALLRDWPGARYAVAARDATAIVFDRDGVRTIASWSALPGLDRAPTAVLGSVVYLLHLSREHTAGEELTVSVVFAHTRLSALVRFG